MSRVELGDLAKDIITDFKGIVVAKTEWLSGCDRICLQPRELKDGKRIDNATFDITEIEVIKKGVVKPLLEEPEETKSILERVKAKVGTGGPRPDAVRHEDPVR